MKYALVAIGLMIAWIVACSPEEPHKTMNPKPPTVPATPTPSSVASTGGDFVPVTGTARWERGYTWNQSGRPTPGRPTGARRTE
jgi:hypothetical protein